MDDLTFVQRCLDRDPLAWNEFIERYSRLIYTYIYSVLKVKGVHLYQEQTADIFHDIFVSLVSDNFHKLKSFKGKNGCSLASWLRKITINFTIDYVRKYKPLVSLEEEKAEKVTLKDILPAEIPHPSEVLTARQNIETLQECISLLSTEDRYFVELHLYRRMDLEMLRVHLRISRSAIDMRKSRIFDRLRDCFKRKGFM